MDFFVPLIADEGIAYGSVLSCTVVVAVIVGGGREGGELGADTGLAVGGLSLEAVVVVGWPAFDASSSTIVGFPSTCFLEGDPAAAIGPLGFTPLLLLFLDFDDDDFLSSFVLDDFEDEEGDPPASSLTLISIFLDMLLLLLLLFSELIRRFSFPGFALPAMVGSLL